MITGCPDERSVESNGLYSNICTRMSPLANQNQVFYINFIKQGCRHKVGIVLTFDIFYSSGEEVFWPV